MDGPRLPPDVTIRAIRPDDVLLLERFYAALSRDSLDARFHGGTRGIAEGAARMFCGPDHLHREGLVAVTREADGTETIVGHLCLEPTTTRDVEMAVAVADAWQHHGIGGALLAASIDWGQTCGFARIHGAIRWSNPAILGLIRGCGRPVRIVTAIDGEMDAVIDVRGEVPAAA